MRFIELVFGMSFVPYYKISYQRKIILTVFVASFVCGFATKYNIRGPFKI